MNKLLLLLGLFGLPAAVFSQSSSALPATISYSGKVIDATGAPVGSPNPVTRTITFRIWNDATATGAANRLWSESQSATITGGEFSVLVGQGTSVAGEPRLYTNFADVFNSGANAFYLGVTVDDGILTTVDPELSPRQQIVTTPFAFRAKVAESVAPASINSAALANGAVGTSTQIADGAVTSAKIDSLHGDKIQGGTIPLSALSTGAINALGAVDGAKIVAGTITSGKIKASEITGGVGGNLATDTIDYTNLKVGSVRTGQILNGTITAEDLAGEVDLSGNVTTPGAVSTIKLQHGAVTRAKLADNAVDSSKIEDGSITAADLAPNSVDSTKIVAASISRTRLTADVQAALKAVNVIYNQGVSETVTTKNTLIPIDLEDLGNDADGCKMMIYFQNQSDSSSMAISQLSWWLQQKGFGVDNNYPEKVRARVVHTFGTGVVAVNFLLNPSSTGSVFLQTENAWVGFHTYYPGSLVSSAPAPFNADQQPSASNSNAGGPAVTFKVVSVVAGEKKLTITLDNPHAIQIGDWVEINGMTGDGITEAMTNSPKPTAVETVNNVAYPPRDGKDGYLRGGLKVTAKPSRTSFEIGLDSANPSGVYSGGTVKHQPLYNRYRVWAKVLSGVSARFIVSDN